MDDANTLAVYTTDDDSDDQAVVIVPHGHLPPTMTGWQLESVHQVSPTALDVIIGVVQ